MDDMPRWLEFALNGYIAHLPSYAAWLIGAVVALVRWGKHPQVSLLTLLTCCLMLALLAVFPLAYWFLAPYIVEHLIGRFGLDTPAKAFTLVNSVITFVIACAQAVFVAILLVALFGWRGNRRQQGGLPPGQGLTTQR